MVGEAIRLNICSWQLGCEVTTKKWRETWCGKLPAGGKQRARLAIGKMESCRTIFGPSRRKETYTHPPKDTKIELSMVPLRKTVIGWRTAKETERRSGSGHTQLDVYT